MGMYKANFLSFFNEFLKFNTGIECLFVTPGSQWNFMIGDVLINTFVAVPLGLAMSNDKNESRSSHPCRMMLYLWPLTCDYIQKKKKKPSNHHNAQRTTPTSSCHCSFLFHFPVLSNLKFFSPAHCPPITRGSHGPWAFSLSFFTFLISPQ